MSHPSLTSLSSLSFGIVVTCLLTTFSPQKSTIHIFQRSRSLETFLAWYVVLLTFRSAFGVIFLAKSVLAWHLFKFRIYCEASLNKARRNSPEFPNFSQTCWVFTNFTCTFSWRAGVAAGCKQIGFSNSHMKHRQGAALLTPYRKHRAKWEFDATCRQQYVPYEMPCRWISLHQVSQTTAWQRPLPNKALQAWPFFWITWTGLWRELVTYVLKKWHWILITDVVIWLQTKMSLVNSWDQRQNETVLLSNVSGKIPVVPGYSLHYTRIE